MEILVDPAVSRAKFEQELSAYREIEEERRQHGWFMINAEFPEVFVIFGVPQIKPPPIAFGALFDFTNYDLWPPSVKLVDPFTKVPYKKRELPVPPLLRKGVAKKHNDQQENSVPAPQALLQAHTDDNVPFLCLPGVREYHQHPAHTGDDWFLHRGNGEGTLYFLLEQLYKYGIKPLSAYHMQMQVQSSAMGLAVNLEALAE